jgi:flagellar basal body-associated protein FliL
LGDIKENPMERKTDKNRFLHFYVGSVALFLVLAAVGYYWVDREGLLSASSPPSAPPHESKADRTYVDLPRMAVSLGGGTGNQVRVNISLEVDRKDASVVEGYLPQIMDKLNVFFPKVQIEELRNPRAMFILHKDMLWQINSIGMPFSVHDLMLQNLVVM